MTHQWTLPASDAEKSLFLRNASDALSETFGSRFEWWTRGQATPPADSHSATAQANNDEWNRLLDRCWGGDGEPQVVHCPDGECLLAIPVHRHRHSPCVATARFPATPDVTPHLLVKLARLFQRTLAQQTRLEQHEGEMAASAVQISEYMEELCFLRSMAERLELSEASHDVWQVAQSTLPMLGPILKAETLALIAARHEKGASPDSPSDVGSVVVWTGSRWPGEELCRRLIMRFRKQITDQPLVSNHFDTEYAVEFPGVGQLIIVPLLKGIQEMGWLVAINRLVVPTDENVPLGMSDLEFGTVEAGLLASAASMLATQASNVELFVAKEGLLVGVVRAMVSALDAKDPYTCGHSERVALVGQRLARQLGLDERYCNQLYLTGLLHDIGKIGISDAVLSKPGKLSDQEFDEIKRHPDQGWLILHDLDPLNYVLPGVLHHHESYNGTGYPDQLAGDEIPLDARILAVADAYDAMSSDRPYRKGMDAEKVDAILRAGAGTQWDARVIEAFFTARDEIRTISESYRPRAIASRRKQQAEQAAAKVREDFSSKAEAVARQ